VVARSLIVALATLLAVSGTETAASVQGGQTSARERFLELAAQAAHRAQRTDHRADALTVLAIECHKAGLHEKAAEAVEDALSAARGEAFPDLWTGRICQRLTEGGALSSAHHVAELIESPETRARALAAIARAELEAGQEEEAGETLSAACQAAALVEPQSARANVAAHLAGTCALLQSAEVASPRLGELIALSAQLPAADRDRILADIAATARAVGLPERVAEACAAMSDALVRATALADLADGAVEAGQIEEAAFLLETAGEAAEACAQTADRARLLARIAEGYGRLGLRSAAEALMARARQLEKGAPFSDEMAAARAAIARAYLSVDRPAEALRVAENAGAPEHKAAALTHVAGYYLAAGEYEQAVALAARLPGRLGPPRGLAALVEQRAQAGDYAQARKLIAEIESATFRGRALYEAARMAARNGDVSVALEFAAALESESTREQALGTVVDEALASVAAAGRLQTVRELEAAVATVRGPDERLAALVALAKAALEAGSREDAARIARQIEVPSDAHANLAMEVSGLLAKAGEGRTAERLARKAMRVARRNTCGACRRKAFRSIHSALLASGQLDLLLEAAEATGSAAAMGESFLALAKRELEAGRASEARGLLARVMEAAGQTESPEESVRLLASVGEAYERARFQWGEAEDAAARRFLAGTAITAAPSGAAEGEVEVLFFSTPGCKDCQRVEALLDQFRKDLPHLVVREYSLADPSGAALNKGICVKLRLPEADHLSAPAVFAAREGLVGARIDAESLKGLIERARGQAGIWRMDPLLRELGGPELERTYRDLTLPAVIGAGLVDGINPCAFAVITWLISARAKKRWRWQAPATRSPCS